MANIAIVGCWHQGTVLSACFADMGHSVCGVPVDQKSAKNLDDGRAPVFEPGLDELLGQHRRNGRLRFTTDVPEAVRDAEFVFVSFDTPVDDDDLLDLTVVTEAAHSVGASLRHDVVLVVTAQVPVGTSTQLADIVARESGSRCDVAYVPEFLRLGAALETFRQADRFVIGCDDERTARRVTALYEPVGRPLLATPIRAAEMSKHACNAFLGTSIALANEIADRCDETGVDFYDVIDVMKLDARIGPHAFLTPGLGFAGGTLGRDLRVLQRLRVEPPPHASVIDAVVESNRERPSVVIRRLASMLGGLDGRDIGILGLTYKPGTSTIRRSAALRIIADLVAEAAKVRAFDPLADLSEADHLPPFTMCDDVVDAADGADALVLVTEWEGLAELDFGPLLHRMRGTLFLDTRNVLPEDRLRGCGFRYVGIGRGDIAPGEAA
jgi:UDPglucose 6-dehydrogenase